MVEIYGTLGPACSDSSVLEQMFRNGMTGIRLNLSHTTLEQASDMIAELHKAAAVCGIIPKLLIDMQGPELRTGKLEAPVFLKEGSVVTLGPDGIPVPSITIPYMKPGQQILIDDGKLLLEVTASTESSVCALVVRGGELKSSKSMALPGSNIYPPTMTAQDIENINNAMKYGVTGIMQPFVRNAEDLRIIRKALNDAGADNVRIFAKIENLDGVENLDELMTESDEIVIARGDLGNAVDLWDLPKLQKYISEKCRNRNMPFMVVTQMLASMESRPVPTRAEVSDIYNAVLDGAASVMVTGETAAGKYPAEVIRYLSRTVRSALI